MKAVVVTARGVYDWQEIPAPTPGPQEALVKIEVCGICNTTDVELIDGTQGGTPKLPFVLGHESVGTVVEVGAEVTKYRVGDRVTRAAAILPGGQRDGLFSGWGGYAQYGLVVDAAPGSYTPDRQIVLPEGCEAETAFLAISLAETRAWLEQVAEQCGSLAGQAVVVVGTGVAGLTLTHWARVLGADPVITLGRRPERLALAQRSGAHLALKSNDEHLAEQVRERTGGRLAKFLIEAIGKPAVLPSLAPLLAPQAVVAIYGAAANAEYEQAYAQLPPDHTHLRPGPEEHRYVAQCAAELRDGMIDPGLWRTHLWEMDELHDAFTQVAAGEVVKGCVRDRWARDRAPPTWQAPVLLDPAGSIDGHADDRFRCGRHDHTDEEPPVPEPDHRWVDGSTVALVDDLWRRRQD